MVAQSLLGCWPAYPQLACCVPPFTGQATLHVPKLRGWLRQWQVRVRCVCFVLASEVKWWRYASQAPVCGALLCNLTVPSLHSVVPLVQMGETDANVAKFLNRCLSGVWLVCLTTRDSGLS